MQHDLFAVHSDDGRANYEHTDLGHGAALSYCSQWLPAQKSQALFNELLSTLEWQQPSIQIAGKSLPIPRLQHWMGDPQVNLRYSGAVFQSKPWCTSLMVLRDLLQQSCGVRFNSVLVNLYEHGQHGVGWHADDEKELGSSPYIASLSLGATRRFDIKTKPNYLPQAAHLSKRLSFELACGDLLIMKGSTQRHWLHSLPKTTKVVGARINLTFRNVYEFYHKA